MHNVECSQVPRPPGAAYASVVVSTPAATPASKPTVADRLPAPASDQQPSPPSVTFLAGARLVSAGVALAIGTEFDSVETCAT